MDNPSPRPVHHNYTPVVWTIRHLDLSTALPAAEGIPAGGLGALLVEGVPVGVRQVQHLQVPGSGGPATYSWGWQTIGGETTVAVQASVMPLVETWITVSIFSPPKEVGAGRAGGRGGIMALHSWEGFGGLLKVY